MCSSSLLPVLPSQGCGMVLQVAWWSGGSMMTDSMVSPRGVDAIAAWKYGPETPGNHYGGKSDYY